MACPNLARPRIYRPGFAIALAALTAGCYSWNRPSGKSYTDGYDAGRAEQMRAADEAHDRYVALLKASRASDDVLFKTGQLAIRLNNASAALVDALREHDRALAQSCGESLRSQALEKVDQAVQAAVDAARNLQVQVAQTNRDRLLENLQVNSSKQEQGDLGAIYLLQAQPYTDEVAGLREAFVRMASDARGKAAAACPSSALPAPLDLDRFRAVIPPSGGGSPATGSVSGRVLAPNGTDPISGALVYVPFKGNERLPFDPALPKDQGALSCGEPGEEYKTKTCSKGDGGFKLEGLPKGDLKYVVKKGAFVKWPTVRVEPGREVLAPEASTTLPRQDGQDGQIARIAVARGQYDKLDLVLRKLGLSQSAAAGLGFADIADLSSLLRDPIRLQSFHVLMINCGAPEDSVYDVQAMANLKNFVARGGRLFVTDQAYDFVNAAFPSAIVFAGGAARNSAQRGQSGVHYQASIEDFSLLSWLKTGVGCGDGSKPCVGPGDLVAISGFANQWAQMERTQPSQTRIWVKNDERPLTATFSHGAGKVFFSSYHTHRDSSGNDVFPQERILQYFVTEVGN